MICDTQLFKRRGLTQVEHGVGPVTGQKVVGQGVVLTRDKHIAWLDKSVQRVSDMRGQLRVCVAVGVNIGNHAADHLMYDIDESA